MGVGQAGPQARPLRTTHHSGYALFPEASQTDRRSGWAKTIGAGAQTAYSRRAAPALLSNQYPALRASTPVCVTRLRNWSIHARQPHANDCSCQQPIRSCIGYDEEAAEMIEGNALRVARRPEWLLSFFCAISSFAARTDILDKARNLQRGNIATRCLQAYSPTQHDFVRPRAASLRDSGQKPVLSFVDLSRFRVIYWVMTTVIFRVICSAPPLRTGSGGLALHVCRPRRSNGVSISRMAEVLRDRPFD